MTLFLCPNHHSTDLQEGRGRRGKHEEKHNLACHLQEVNLLTTRKDEKIVDQLSNKRIYLE